MKHEKPKSSFAKLVALNISKIQTICVIQNQSYAIPQPTSNHSLAKPRFDFRWNSPASRSRLLPVIDRMCYSNDPSVTHTHTAGDVSVHQTSKGARFVRCGTHLVEGFCVGGFTTHTSCELVIAFWWVGCVWLRDSAWSVTSWKININPITEALDEEWKSVSSAFSSEDFIKSVVFKHLKIDAPSSRNNSWRLVVAPAAAAS